MGSLISVATAVAGAALSASQANRAASQQVRTNNQQLAMRGQQVQLQHQTEERRRKQQLKESKATGRAKFGGAGIGSASGSAAAVLTGFQRKSAKAGAEAAADKRLGLQTNLLNVQNSNRRALQNAAFAREGAALKAASGLARGIASNLSPGKKSGNTIPVPRAG